jgi:hypothetical protein
MGFLCPGCRRGIDFLCRSSDFLAGGRETSCPKKGCVPMLDTIFVLLGLGGFAVCLAYVHLCARL